LVQKKELQIFKNSYPYIFEESDLKPHWTQMKIRIGRDGNDANHDGNNEANEDAW